MSLALVAIPLLALPTAASVPYPLCEQAASCDPGCLPGDSGCIGPDDYADYLFLAPGVLPDDYFFDPDFPTAGSAWIYQGENPEAPAAEGSIGHDVVGAWRVTTGRPDVVAAVLDSGIRWEARDLRNKVALNTGELPLPTGCAPSYDCDGNGVVNVDDFEGATCGAQGQVFDANENGALDGQDLIIVCSDGIDDDANGYVDDIAGWDFHQNDNDPVDDVEYGHGTGQGTDQVAEADNGFGMPGPAPASMFVPIKVSDSFVGVGTDFAQAVVYAVDRHVSLISEALGTVSAGPAGQAAIDYAYERGIPVIASAADEQSRHHNYPAAYEHTIWVNSVLPADDDLIQAKEPPEFTLQNGCTNHGGHAWVAVGSKSCSSEATGRLAGMASLLIAHGKNLVDRGELDPYPGLDTPFSAEEVRQLLRQAAVDVDHSADPSLTFGGTLQLAALLLSAPPPLDLPFTTSHFDTQPGWDQYTGYGRPDVVDLVSVTASKIPPEADLSGSLRWFDVVDPAAQSTVPVVASARAVRDPGVFDWMLEVGCGVQPVSFDRLAGASSSASLVQALLHDWDAAATAASCGFDPSEVIDDPDAHTVTLRLQVRDSRGNLGEDRRTVAIHSDPELKYPPVWLGASGDGTPTLADVDGDEVLDIVYGTSAGEVHALDGATGRALPGFPALTSEIAVHPSPAYPDRVPVPRETVLASTAVDDLDGDGAVEIVAASSEGGVFVFDRQGRLRDGFPVRVDPARSDPDLRDRWNDLDPGISGAPTLADLDGPGGDGGLEILTTAWDGHLYAWRADGSEVDGFPVKLADRAKLDVDADTGRVTPRSGLDRSRLSRLAKSVGSPAVGDLDGDGFVEIVAATNEEYVDEPETFDADSRIFQILKDAGFEDLRVDVASRIYAVNHDGSFLETIDGQPTSWPARVPLLVSGLLPNVATGTPGSPALADLDGDGKLVVAVFGAVGPVMLLDGSGAPILPPFGGLPSPLAIDFPGVLPGSAYAGFYAVPETFLEGGGSPDAPFFGSLGSGAFGDIDGDGQPEYVAPTAGIRQFIEVLTPGRQEFRDHQITAWNPEDGSLLPDFPRPMDDMMFISSPTLADVSGDGEADVVQGSGVYLVRAYEADGAVPAGFPKFTHGWMISSPTVGDVDGDGRNEVVVATREGRLFVWDTSGLSRESAIPWQGFGRDRRNTQNLASGVRTTVPEPGLGLLRVAALSAVLVAARGRGEACRAG